MRKLIHNKRLMIILGVILATIAASAAVWYISGLKIELLEPRGIVAFKQYNLLVFTTLLGFVVVIPVFVMAVAIAWRYREGNTKAKYTPNVSTNRLAETIWWGIPIILIAILSVVTWTSTHDLDPHKPLESQSKPVKIQVIALDWKWLFIYPEQNIATVNYIQFPVNRPVNFEITADAPMNSFWIPQLGGQIYAMSGMTTKLHLNANEIGSYTGKSANISGEGFADMKFIAKASSKSDFDAWVNKVQQSDKKLTQETYNELLKKSIDAPVTYYASSTEGLYDTIVMKYMMPETTKNTDETKNDAMDHSAHGDHAEMGSH
jgi:cytochrome o ubiquinol oxidase subunit II